MATKHAWHNYLTCDSCRLLDKSVRPVNDGNFCPSCVPNPPEADTLRRQRDELLQALRALAEIIALQMEYTNARPSTYSKLQDVRRILAQYTEDTPQEDSNE